MYYNLEARKKLKAGMDELSRAVIVTLGPRGRTVVFEKGDGSVQVCNDGVSVAKQVELEDTAENLGAKMIREAAIKTGDTVGDGTTTSILFAQAMIHVGLRRIEAGIRPMDVKKGIDKAVAVVVEALKKQAISIESDPRRIEQVAAISANNDQEIGKLIAEATRKAGKEGVITIEEAKGIETSVEVVEGMRFNKGYLSPYFITNPERMEVEFDHPFILIYDKKLTGMNSLVPLLDKVIQAERPLVIIAEDIEGEALAVLVLNRLRGVLKIVAVKAPEFGDRRKEILEDLAILTGATVISEEKGIKVENTELKDLGQCEKVLITKDSTTIINGSGSRENMDARMALIKSQLKKEETSDYEREKLQERLAKLAGGVAVVYVGASTEVELNEKKERVDDALHATRAAIEEGIVPGGGVSYLRALSTLDKIEVTNEDEKVGIEIVRKSLEEPLRQIVANAGLEPAEIIQRVKAGKNDYGFNAKTEEYENLLTSGVIDPVKVNRLALEHAASVAGMFLITECIIAKKPERKESRTPEMLSEVF